MALSVAKTPQAVNEAGDPIDMTQDEISISRRGQQIVLPPKMSYDEGIEWLKRKQREDETLVAIYHDLEAFPLDGAYAFSKAIDEIYGWSAAQAVMVTMSVSHNKTVQVPWGAVIIPGIEGTLETGLDTRVCPPKFVIKGKVKAKHRAEILVLYEKTKDMLAKHSVYRGKAIRVDFSYERTGRGFSPSNDEPKFIDISDVNPADLIFEETTKKIIRMTLFSLIEKSSTHAAAWRTSEKGVLLAGKYGTGKTMTANVTAKLAVDNDWTFIYLKDVQDLAYALRFANNMLLPSCLQKMWIA